MRRGFGWWWTALVVTAGCAATRQPGPPIVETAAHPCACSASTASSSASAVRYGRRSLEEWTLDLSDRDPETRKAGFIAIAAIGPDAAPAVPALLTALRGPGESDHEWGVRAVAAIGTPAVAAVPLLVQGLGPPETPLQGASYVDMVRALGVMAPASTEALDALRGAIVHDDRRLASAAAIELVRRDLDRERGLNALRELLAHDDSSSVAIAAIDQLGADAKPLASQVEARYVAGAFRDYESERAQRVLERFGSVSAFERTLDAEPPFPSDAVSSLSTMAGRNPAAMVALVRVLEHRDPTLRAHAARCFGSMETVPPTAVRALAEHLTDPDDSVRQDVAKALASQPTQPPWILEKWITALSDTNRLVRIQAVEALGRMGPAAKAAIPALESLPDRNSRLLKGDVERALRQIRGGV